MGLILIVIIAEPLSLEMRHDKHDDMETTDKKQALLAYQREYRKKTKNSVIHKYEKTKNGFLMRLYRNMKSRVEGVQWSKHHLYSGKFLLPKEEFYEWAKSSAEFHRLFDEYEKQGYPRTMAPSVDRIDSSRGYEINNMEWVTMLENSTRGVRSRYAKASAQALEPR